jgi:hypothetical protein
MKRNIEPSRDQLLKSSERRIKHLMVQTLTKFEDRFQDLANSNYGEIFKSDLRNAFNDAIRAQRDELYDYQIEYRPLKLNSDNTIMATKTFLDALQSIEFIDGDRPGIRIKSHLQDSKLLDAIRSELGAGVLYSLEKVIIFEIRGLEDSINCVLPLLDRCKFNEGVRNKYLVWRKVIVTKYQGDRNG